MMAPDAAESSLQEPVGHEEAPSSLPETLIEALGKDPTPTLIKTSGPMPETQAPSQPAGFTEAWSAGVAPG